MANDPDVIVGEIIASIDPHDFSAPPEFVITARIISRDGSEMVVTASELQTVLANPDDYDIAATQYMLDVQKINESLTKQVENIIEAVRDLLDENL